jgi:hypothetical protein
MIIFLILGPKGGVFWSLRHSFGVQLTIRKQPERAEPNRPPGQRSLEAGGRKAATATGRRVGG